MTPSSRAAPNSGVRRSTRRSRLPSRSQGTSWLATDDAFTDT